MRIFKNKPFGRFARKNGIGDEDVCHAIRDIERAQITADLGGGVIKQRLARPGQGKSGGFRIMILFKADARAIFVHGFAKSERDNLRDDELLALRKLASELLAYDEEAIGRAIAAGALTEVMCDEQAIQ